MTDPAAAVSMEDAFGVLLRRCLGPAAAAGLLCAAVALLARGVDEMASALVGAAIVIGFFGARLVVMRRTARSNPQLVLVVALAVYTAKVVLLGVAMLLLTQVSWVDGPALGLTVLLTAVVWLAAEMRGFVRLRIPVFAAGGQDGTGGGRGTGS
ncbi:hypothetical protein [Kineococcus glutinatus]|uniref:ATP synthase protein I n=1 Tax=Kineococcus glutinatus TaxID=1070872 RepID=A0ABP8VGQ3_9ACTN